LVPRGDQGRLGLGLGLALGRKPGADGVIKGAMSRSAAPSRAVKLFGTDEPSTPLRRLSAGPLSVVLDGGNLRTIRVGEIEALRGIAFLCRDENWGTYAPALSQLDLQEAPDRFTIRYQAVCSRPGQSLRYEARIEGRADGSLRFEATATPETEFLTCRTGFVILHPLRGVAGRPVEIEHTDGRIERAMFPETIDPAQPFFDVRALTHEVMRGVTVRCLMEGDAFETEDQRNWSDASFKTYVRPLALPFPYRLAAGVPVTQAVTLTFSGLPDVGRTAPAPEPSAQTAGEIAVELGPVEDGNMPLVGVGLRPEEAALALGAQDLLRALGIQMVVGHFDPRAGHGARELAGLAKVASAMGAALALEAVLPCEAKPEVELGRLAALVRETRLPLAALAVSPAAHLKSIQPGQEGPALPSLEEIYAAARLCLPGVRLGGGSFAYFTELNRKRPPADRLDFVTHTTCAVIHAADDVSVMETLQALPFITRSTRAFIGGAAYRLGPVALGMRQNPYGAAPLETDGLTRVPTARSDPRQRGLYASAYYLGYAASVAPMVEALTLGAPTGPFGFISTPQPHPRPWYDERPGEAVYPAFHTVRWIAAGAGRRRRQARTADEQTVQAVAYGEGGGAVLLLANLTGAPQRVRIKGMGQGQAQQVMLDESTFEAAATAPLIFDQAAARMVPLGDGITLAPYAVVRLQSAG
jgi:D-apionolactonase